MQEIIKNKIWWSYIHTDIQELLSQSVLLIDTAEKWKSELANGKDEFHDYAFVVFPAAKAYEGFLKKLFFDLNFITEEDYYGKRFRIGRALNPSLEKELRESESVYDRLVTYCDGHALADNLWQTWKNCRNLLFHWFPNEKNAISQNESIQKVHEVIESIDLAYKECKMEEK